MTFGTPSTLRGTPKMTLDPQTIESLTETAAKRPMTKAQWRLIIRVLENYALQRVRKTETLSAAASTLHTYSNLMEKLRVLRDKTAARGSESMEQTEPEVADSMGRDEPTRPDGVPEEV